MSQASGAMDITSLLYAVASDRAGRGASFVSRPTAWEEALALCWDAKDVLIVTGFFIPSMDACETDGPLGSVVLGRALASLGKRVVLMGDERDIPVLRAVSEAVGGPGVVAGDGALPQGPELVIFIERPGRAEDGTYRDMRGADISSEVVPLDGMAQQALDRGIPVLGIGDGGNEAGMGPLRELLARGLPDYAMCLSCVPATVALAADVSNWGAYALAALLSVRHGEWLGLSPGEEERMLRAAVAAGAVDGAARRKGLSVDGFPLPLLVQVGEQIEAWYRRTRERDA